MTANGAHAAGNGRKKILDLAPLELECLHGLWPLGEATVRQIRNAVAGRRPRAYTTIMTVMDRLARNGVVTRRRTGRAWLYRAEISAGEARARAVQQVVEHFFAGSAEALASHLRGEPVSMPAGAPAGASVSLPAAAPRKDRMAHQKRPPREVEAPPAASPKLDDTLL
jgi:BlaI family penicillinase repressor